jgi:hypothetical protein
MTGRPCYSSGDEVRMGDRISYAGTEGVVRRVFWEAHSEPMDEISAWFVETYQRGVMIETPRVGPCLFHTTEQEGDLVFVSRRDGATA